MRYPSCDCITGCICERPESTASQYLAMILLIVLFVVLPAYVVGV